MSKNTAARTVAVAPASIPAPVAPVDAAPAPVAPVAPVDAAPAPGTATPPTFRYLAPEGSSPHVQRAADTAAARLNTAAANGADASMLLAAHVGAASAVASMDAAWVSAKATRAIASASGAAVRRDATRGIVADALAVAVADGILPARRTRR